MAMPKQRSSVENRQPNSEKIDFSIFKKFTDGFYALDTTWHYLYVNKKGAELAQMSQKELQGKSAKKLFSDAHVLEFGKTLELVKKDGKPRIIEAYYPRHKKWYEAVIFPIKDCIGVISRDITERKQTEDVRFQLAAIVSSSDDAIISKDLKSIVISWNTAAEKMFGYTEKEMIGKSIRTIIPKDLQKEEDLILAKLRKGQRIEHFQTVRINKNGQKINVSLTISPIKNFQGKVIGASKIARDITHLKRTEDNLKFLAEASKELATSLNYEKTLINIASLTIPHIADWCSVEMLNAEGSLNLVAIAHKDPNQVKWAKNLRKINPPNMQAQTGLPQVLRTGKTEIYPIIDNKMLEQSARNKKELNLLRKLHLTSAIITPIISQGKPIGGITFISTESTKQYTKSDVAMAEELAGRASLAIENARLYRDMQKELAERKKLEKQKDEFIGVASHELKTPVTSIKSFAQILRYKFQKNGFLHEAELLGKLDAQIDKLTALIGDLLDVTKIEAGKLIFNKDTFSFDVLLAEIIEEMQRTTQKHTIRIEGLTKQTILSDRERIGQVLINLISNAIKYSPYANEIIIHSLVENGSIKVCVQDFGVGISEDKQEKVFDRFFRVSGPGKETYPGLGLGLYISNEIVKRLHGRIWVQSVEGKGSTFCFTIPLKKNFSSVVNKNTQQNISVSKSD